MEITSKKNQYIASNNLSKNKFNYLVVMPRFTIDIETPYMFPLGIAYVSSSLKYSNYKIFTLNPNHYSEPLYELMYKYINNHSINVVMTGGLSPHYHMINDISDISKKIDKKIIVVVGGGIITSNPFIAMQALNSVDIGVIGEGELTAVELCKALENNTNLLEVNGLIIKNSDIFVSNIHNDSNLYRTNKRREISNIDHLPWPDYQGFEFEKTLEKNLSLVGFNNKRTVTMISSRSCPYKCTFCFHTCGNIFRQRTIENFFEELDYLISKYDIQGLMLLDELFGRDFKRFSNFFKRVISKKIKISISMRVNYIKPEMIPLLKESKCIVGLGLESADNSILKSMQKKITVDQIEYTLNLLHSNGIPFNGNFIFGDISETIETAKNTLSWRLKHPQYNIFMRLITPYPGSHIYKYAVDHQLIQNEIEYLMDGCPQINISKMTDDQFKQVVNMINENLSNHAQQLHTYTTKKSSNGYMYIDVNGVCKVCGTENSWEDTAIFMPTFLVCDECGSQYYPPLPKEIYAVFEQSVLELLAKYQRIALWGIAYHAVEVIKFSGITSYSNIYLIDKCASKHNSTINGKLINPPIIISMFKINSVIIMVPAHQGMIAGQINHQFPGVKIFNIFDLL